MPKLKEIQNIVQKLSREQDSVAGGGGAAATYESVQKHKITPAIPG